MCLYGLHLTLVLESVDKGRGTPISMLYVHTMSAFSNHCDRDRDHDHDRYRDSDRDRDRDSDGALDDAR